MKVRRAVGLSKNTDFFPIYHIQLKFSHINVDDKSSYFTRMKPFPHSCFRSFSFYLYTLFSLCLLLPFSFSRHTVKSLPGLTFPAPTRVRDLSFSGDRTECSSQPGAKNIQNAFSYISSFVANKAATSVSFAFEVTKMGLDGALDVGTGNDASTGFQCTGFSLGIALKKEVDRSLYSLTSLPFVFGKSVDSFGVCTEVRTSAGQCPADNFVSTIGSTIGAQSSDLSCRSDAATFSPLPRVVQEGDVVFIKIDLGGISESDISSVEFNIKDKSGRLIAQQKLILPSELTLEDILGKL